jgi:KDO2-lipid IV(A) lauroyltransferase
MEKLTYHIVYALLFLLALLPLWALYVLSDVIRFFVYHVGHYQLETVRRNLKNSFPEKSGEELKTIERQYYRQLCDNIVESVKLLHVSDRTMRRHVDVRGGELIEQAADDHRPVFMLLGHMGNWEWVQEVSKRVSRPSVQGEIYHPLRSPLAERIMRAVRSRYHTMLIPQKEAVRTIIGMKQQHDSYLIGFIADQRPRRMSLTHWMDFLNQDTPYMVGAEGIGRRVNAKYVYLHVAKPRRGHYVMTLTDMVLPASADSCGRDEHPYTELYMRMLEQNIREYPAQWLWSHKRWKHQREVKN